MKKVEYDYWVEIGAIALTGALPIAGSFIYGGIELMETIISGLLINDWLLYYTAGLSILFAIIAYLDHMLTFRSDVVERIHNKLSNILVESISALNGVLRTTSGMLCGLTLLWLVCDFKTEEIPLFVYLGSIGVIAGVESFLLAKFINHAKTKWLKHVH